MELSKYEVLTKETFYKCRHILHYLNHNKFDPLDEEAIKATIMDALVARNAIDPEREFLDLEREQIVTDSSKYHYDATPNVTSIPIDIKDELRRHCIKITAGTPISMFLARPPRKTFRYCVYDPNTAFSAMFEDATFYTTYYDSPTRKVRIDSPRPFVEVNINGELYLVDTITNRIFKSSWFIEKFNMEVIRKSVKKEYSGIEREEYLSNISPSDELVNYLLVTDFMNLDHPKMAELKYEIERTKIDHQDAWEELRLIREDMKQKGY